MYIVHTISENAYTTENYRTKADAMKAMRSFTRACKAWGIRSHSYIEKDGQTIETRRTSGTKYARA
jgi:hypothetical protein